MKIRRPSLVTLRKLPICNKKVKGKKTKKAVMLVGLMAFFVSIDEMSTMPV